MFKGKNAEFKPVKYSFIEYCDEKTAKENYDRIMENKSYHLEFTLDGRNLKIESESFKGFKFSSSKFINKIITNLYSEL